MKAFLSWMVLLHVLSLAPLKKFVPQTVTLGDVAAHFAMYAITCVVTYRMLRGHRFFPFSAMAALLIAFFFSSGYGMLIEVFQGMTKYRYFSWEDGLSNTAGAFVAGTAIMIARWRASSSQDSVAMADSEVEQD